MSVKLPSAINQYRRPLNKGPAVFQPSAKDIIHDAYNHQYRNAVKTVQSLIRAKNFAQPPHYIASFSEMMSVSHVYQAQPNILRTNTDINAWKPWNRDVNSHRLSRIDTN